MTVGKKITYILGGPYAYIYGLKITWRHETFPKRP